MHSPPSGRPRRNRTLILATVPILSAPLITGAVSPDLSPSPAARSNDTPTVEPTNAPPAQGPLELDEPATITLITGDTVTVHPGNAVSITPAEGREHIDFDETNNGATIRVVPADAQRLMAEGKLDERLFDVAYLVREGYADRDTLPLIIEGDEQQVDDLADGPDAAVTYESDQLQLAAVEQDRAAEEAPLWSRMTNNGTAAPKLPAGVDKIWLDGMVHVTLDESVPQIGAPQVWESGYTGKGVTVAVLDTGIDTTHPDLADKVGTSEVFSEDPNTGAFAVEQLDHSIGYRWLIGARVVPKQGMSDPVVYVGRACVDSEGDELAADPAGKTALIARDQEACSFAEKYDAVVEAGATGVLIHNDEPGLFVGTVFGAEHLNAVWGAAISDATGAALVDLLDEGNGVTLEFTEQPFKGDLHGHGTHVAATIAGTGNASGGARQGVAPDAELISGAVCDASGSCQDSWVIAGMMWAVEQGADVVNMSLGGCCTDGSDPLSQAVNTLSKQHDALFVVSAGNSGQVEAVGSPGVADAALTVGAVDKGDQLAWFSSRGPRRGDQAVKPEVTAPGVAIVAARAVGTSLGEPVDGHYTSLNGTSMSTPHVAGAAALLAQARPELGAAALKDALTSTAVDGETMWFEQGAGRIDVTRAVGQGVYASASVNLGSLDGDDSAVRHVTYSNHTDHVVTLGLDAALTDLVGRSVDPLKLSRKRIVVRPGRHTTVAVTIDARAVDRPGNYGGVITAVGKGVTLRTAVGFGVEREVIPLDDDWDEQGTSTYRIDGPGTNLGMKGAALSPDGTQLFLFGSEAGSVDNPRILLLAVDTATGEEIWTATQPVSRAARGPSPGIAVAPDGSRVFVTQNVWDAERRQLDILTAAFNNTPPRNRADAALGEQLWQARFHDVGPSPGAQPAGAQRVAISPDGETVIVAGARSKTGEGLILTIAYDTDTGEQSWASTHGNPGVYNWGGDVAISPTSDLAYVSGIVSHGPTGQDRHGITIAYVLRGNEAGTTQWVSEHESITRNSMNTHTTTSSDGARVFVASETYVAAGDERLTMRAFEATSGQQLWSSEFGAVNHGYLPGHTEPSRDIKGGITVSPNNDLVFITGQHCETGICIGARALITVAFDQATGEQRWFNIHESTGRGNGYGPTGTTATTSPDGSQLYVAGECCWTADGGNDQATLAYDTATGQLIGTARHRFEEKNVRNRGMQVLVSPDGANIYTVSEVWPPGRDYWAVSTYAPPINLSAHAYRSRGRWLVELTWKAPGVDEVDVHRDGELIATVQGTDAYIDELGRARLGGTIEYQVCDANGSRCSMKTQVVIGPRSRGRGPRELS